MTREETAKLVTMLSSEYPESVREQAAEALSYTDESNYDLLINKSMKRTWRYAVKVIKNIGYPKNKSLIPDLIWLLLEYKLAGVGGGC